MKKASVLLGIGLLGVVLLSFTRTHECLVAENSESSNSFEEGLYAQGQGEILNIDDIDFIEEEEEISLEFDTAEYLPLGFNAYEGMELNLDDIIFIEDEENIDLGFNLQDYLPENFDAYSK